MVLGVNTLFMSVSTESIFLSVHIVSALKRHLPQAAPGKRVLKKTMALIGFYHKCDVFFHNRYMILSDTYIVTVHSAENGEFPMIHPAGYNNYLFAILLAALIIVLPASAFHTRVTKAVICRPFIRF